MRYYGTVKILFSLCADSEEELYDILEGELEEDGIIIKYINVEDVEENE